MKSSSPKPRLIQWSKSLEGQQVRKRKHDLLHSTGKCTELSMAKMLPIWQKGMLEESKIGYTKQQSEAIWIPTKRKIS